MSLKKRLTEIADLGKVYPHRQIKDTPEQVTYAFETDDGIKYEVSFYGSSDTDVWLVGFDSVESRQGKKVNPQMIFNTVFDVVKTFHDERKGDFGGFLFHADPKKRRIYKYYINKMFPSAKVEDEGHDPNAMVVLL